MKKVLVVGGAGYIGSHCAKLLSESGITPIVFDNLSTGHREAVKWGPFFKGDLLDPEAVSQVFTDQRPDAVVHFAALTLIPESLEHPDRYHRNNVAGTLNLLEAMRAHGLTNLVFSSSCAVYGAPETSPIDESFSCAPINPYGQTKLEAERALKTFSEGQGIRSISLRYFNAAGADPSGEIGEAHSPETHLIPLALRAASGQGAALEVFGSDFNTPDGTAIRDYIHVNDLAAAHLAALRYLRDGGQTTSVNIGTGTGASVLEIVQAAEKATGRKVPYSLKDRRPGDPAELVADPTLAESLLSWRATTPLARILSDAWGWHANQAFGF
jgi:UDP-arabinose 4-epimerase